jgi:hypothetical protein
MEFWKEVRQRVLAKKLSQRAACKEYGLGWHTLKKILAHDERPWLHWHPFSLYRGFQLPYRYSARNFATACDSLQLPAEHLKCRYSPRELGESWQIVSRRLNPARYRRIKTSQLE